MVSHEFLAALTGEGVTLDPCCTQAHWQNGICERIIKTIFEAAETLMLDHGMSVEDAVHHATESHNSVERVEGYAPTQWAFGRDKDHSGLLHERTEEGELPRNTNEKFQENLKKRTVARQVVTEKIMKNQILRAKQAKSYPPQIFAPGMLVCVWRKGRPGSKKSRGPGIDKGQWYGPGTVLGSQTRREDGGTPLESKKVWVVMGSKLWRCAPEQLRNASNREIETFRHEHPHAMDVRCSDQGSTDRRIRRGRH